MIINTYVRQFASCYPAFSNLKLVGEAESGEEAITLAKKLHPDIILIDINMSPVNGFEATRKMLKQNPSDKDHRLVSS